ncbi:MAG: hypothetical protein ACD_73C00344G0001, partial [uncultured bacterium]
MIRMLQNRYFLSLLFSIILFFIFLTPLQAWAVSYYVDCATGSDTNDCSIGSQCLTIGQAITTASSGDTINIAAGTCTVTSTINPGTKELTIQGAGLMGSNLTRVVASGTVSAVFTYNSASITNSSVLKNLVVQANAGYGVYIGSSANPVIQSNYILGDDDSSAYSSIYISYSAPTIENNIIVSGYDGVLADSSSSAVIRNNTVINTIGSAFYFGDRYNNIAYLNFGYGMYYCTSNDTGHYNTSFGNDTNYNNCTTYNTSADEVDPHFNVSAAGISTGLTTTTLTMTGAGWITNEWAGYFVTPNANRASQAGYFLIVSNTTDTL